MKRPGMLQRLPGDIQRQVGGVHHALYKGEVVRHHLPAFVHNKDPGGVELKALLIVLGVVVIGGVGGNEEHGFVLHLAFGGNVNDGQRLLPVPELFPVELVVFLLLHFALIPLPQGNHGVEGLPLPNSLILGLIVLTGVLRPVLHAAVLHLHADGGMDIVGILLHQFLNAVLVQIIAKPLLLGVGLDVKDDLGTHGLLAARLHSIAVGPVGLPLPCLIGPIGPGADHHPVRHHKGGVEAHAELADDVHIFGGLSRLGPVHLLLKAEGPAAGDGAQILLQFLLRHADAIVGNGQGPGLSVGEKGDLKILPLDVHLIVGEGLIGQLVHRIAGVGEKLPEKDLPVGVDGVDHQIQQPLGFRLELLFCHGMRLRIIS